MKYSFNHITFQVSNLKESLNFYVDFLGLKLARRPKFDFPGAWIFINDEQLIHLIEGEVDYVISGKRSNHIAFNVSDLDELVEKLKESDYRYHGPKARVDGFIQLFVQDPDGYYIEFGQGLDMH